MPTANTATDNLSEVLEPQVGNFLVHNGYRLAAI